MSGDSDYETALVELKRIFPHIYLVIAFPPKRKNAALVKLCDSSILISEKIVKDSLLPSPVINRRSGKKFFMPDEWIVWRYLKVS